MKLKKFFAGVLRRRNRSVCRGRSRTDYEC